jgi:hypothetical protein
MPDDSNSTAAHLMQSDTSPGFGRTVEPSAAVAESIS